MRCYFLSTIFMYFTVLDKGVWPSRNQSMVLPVTNSICIYFYLCEALFLEFFYNRGDYFPDLVYVLSLVKKPIIIMPF